MFRYKSGTSIGKKMKAERIYNKEMEKIAKSDATVFLVRRFLALVVETLKDEFGFGPVRLERFKERLELKLDCINFGNVDWEDILIENE